MEGARHDALRSYVRMIQEAKQSLVSRKTLGSWESMWDAHIADSVQLASQIDPAERVVDVGSGAGFPGIVVGIERNAHVVLVEPRRQRAIFLQSVVDALGLNARVMQCMVSRVCVPCDVITARAVGTLTWLLRHTQHLILQNPRVHFLIIKGTNFDHEIADAKSSGYNFDHSLTPLAQKNGHLVCISQVVCPQCFV